MGAPTVYYYDDPGAPVLTNIQDAFYQILMACLVNGYGSKPAAGWSVVHDQWAAHGHASFTNNTESGVLGLVRNTTSGYGPYLYVAEAMVDYQTAVNARSGMRSNINPATLATASLTGRQRAHGAQWQRWVCIADEQGAWVFFGNTDARLFDPWELRNDAAYVCQVYAGAINSFAGNGSRVAALIGNFVIAGGYGDSTSSSWRDVNNQRPSTLLRGGDGSYAPDGSMLAIHPLFCRSDSSLSGMHLCFYLSPVQIMEAKSSYRTWTPLGELRLLKSCWEIADSGTSYSDARDNARRILPSGQTLRDPVIIDGVPHLMASMGWYAYALISLDAADWA